MPNAIEKGLFLCKDNFVAIKAGYLGDVVWDVDFKTEDGVSSSIKNYHSESHSGLLFVNILNQIEGYGLIGAMKGDFTHRPLFDGRRRKYETAFHPIWGGGLRFIGFYWKCATLGFDGKYVAGNLPIKTIRIQKTASPRGGTWKVRRWQGAAAFSYRLSFFVPYVGVRYSEVKDKVRGLKKAQLPRDRFQIKNRHGFGGTVGVGLFPGCRFAINFEGRFYDEEAFAASFDFQF